MSDPKKCPAHLDRAELRTGNAVGEGKAVLLWDLIRASVSLNPEGGRKGVVAGEDEQNFDAT